MEERKGVKEVDFQEAVSMLNAGHKMVWLGREPLDYIDQLLDLDATKTEKVDFREMMEVDKFKALEFKNCVFVCYHGNMSGTTVRMLKDKYGVEAYSLKGGVTSIVGEIF